MTNTLHNYKSKGDMYAHSLGYLFEEKDWINIKQDLILYTNTVIDLEEKLSEQAEQEPVAIDGLARACNLAGIDYKDFLRIKAYLPIAAPVRTKDMTDDEIAEAVGSPLDEVYLADFRAVIAADREKNR